MTYISMRQHRIAYSTTALHRCLPSFPVPSLQICWASHTVAYPFLPSETTCTATRASSPQLSSAAFPLRRATPSQRAAPSSLGEMIQARRTRNSSEHTRSTTSRGSCSLPRRITSRMRGCLPTSCKTENRYVVSQGSHLRLQLTTCIAARRTHRRRRPSQPSRRVEDHTFITSGNRAASRPLSASHDVTTDVHRRTTRGRQRMASGHVRTQPR